MSESTSHVYVQALALSIAREWRRCPPSQRSADLEAFQGAEAATAGDGVRSVVYSSIGLEPGVDLVLWRWSETVDALERSAARTLLSGLGTSCDVRHSFIGRTAASQYAVRPSDQETGLIGGERDRYLIVYPFTKSTDWYLLSREARQGVMNEHMKVGHTYPSVRQALAYSFGVDDQDFLVAYETDDLAAFGELVRELRGTDSRRSTVRDTPILLAIRRSPDELRELLGA
ncbi:MAG: chlorite dismutase family protein [Candidatus Limnocylindrales bacterium]